MKFVVMSNGKPRSDSHRWYLDGNGQLWQDCDPHGVDMSGKRRIYPAPNNFTVKMIDEERNNNDNF